MLKEMIQHTYGIFDLQSIELSLPRSTPNLRQVCFVGIVQAMVNGHNMLHEYSHSHDMLTIFLVNGQSFFIEAMIHSNLGDLCNLVVD